MIANQLNSCGREARGQRKSIHVWLMAASTILITGLVGSDPAYSGHPFDGLECVFTAGDINSDYYHKETQKWVRNGPPTQQGSIRIYPMTWTLTVEGHKRDRPNNQGWSADNRMNPGSQRFQVFPPDPSLPGNRRIRALDVQPAVVGPFTGGSGSDVSRNFEEYNFPEIVATEVRFREKEGSISGNKTTSLEEQLGYLEDLKSRKQWLIWKDSRRSNAPIGSNAQGRPNAIPEFLSCQMDFTISP